MDEVPKLPIEDPEIIEALRAARPAAPEEDRAAIALGRALGEAGCGYEAGLLLRPRKKLWKGEAWADAAEDWLAANAWWNREGRQIAMLRQEGRHAEALEAIGDRAAQLWDFPPLLMHLEAIARAKGDWAAVEQLDGRILYLTRRGLPKLPEDAFRYFARVGLLEARAIRGDAAEALAEMERLDYHRGNQHHYQMRLAELTLLAGDEDLAMQRVAQTLVTAGKRDGYTKTLRETWAEDAPRLEALRARADWSTMVDDPSAWLLQAE